MRSQIIVGIFMLLMIVNGQTCPDDPNASVQDGNCTCNNKYTLDGTVCVLDCLSINNTEFQAS